MEAETMMNEETMSSGTPKDEETPIFQLNVSNLPRDIEKDGIKSMFSEYGEVTGVVYVRSKNQAYISFGTYQSAERAIHDLHNKPPLKLNIQFPNKKWRDMQTKTHPDLSGPFFDHRYKYVDEDDLNRMRKPARVGRPKYTPTLRPNNYSTEDDLLYPYPSSNDFSTFNPYDKVEPYHDTNLMYTRGITHMSKDGRKFVAYGRGFTYYAIPEPKYDIDVLLQAVYEKREKGNYEYASETIDDETGLCQICSCPTAFRCQKCDIAFYCSKSCQRNDWPTHKLNCQQIPPLVKKISNNEIANGFAKRSPPNNSQTPTMNGEPYRVTAQQDKLRNGAPHSPESSKNGNIQAPYDELKNMSLNTEPLPKQPSPPRSQRNDSPQSQLQQQQCPKPQHQQWKQQQQQQQQLARKKSLSARLSSDEDIVFNETSPFLPRDKFVDVTITNSIVRGEYFVQRNDLIDDLERFKRVLAEAAKSAKFVEPEENVKCILEINGSWYRAEIVSAEKSEVFFFDYGIFDNVEIKRVFRQSFKDYPYFARRIRLVETASEELKALSPRDSLSVKLVSIQKDMTHIVQARPCTELRRNSVFTSEIEEQPAPREEVKPVQKEVEKSTPMSAQTEEDIFLLELEKLPNVFSDLKPSLEGCIMLHAEISQNEYNVTIVINEDFFQNLLSDDLTRLCLDMYKKNINYRPKVGDYVCGSTEDGDWFRCIVASLQPTIKLAVVDECRFFTPTKCTLVPSGYDDIVSMGMICKISSDTPWPKDESSGFFKVIDVSKDFATLEITCETVPTAFKAEVRKWIPKPEQKSILNPNLVSGNNVVAVFVTSASDFYVRIDDPEEKERVHKLEQEIAACARSRKPLAQKPVVGEIVLSFFETDENYYRAIVTKIDGDKFMVKYLDYGNTEVKTIKHLYQLTDSLKTERAGCIKVALKGIQKNTPLTASATDYLLSLVQEEASLHCTFEGNPSQNGVVLKTQKNEIVNDVVKGLLEPTYKKTNPSDDLEVYTMEHLPPSKLGDIGDDVSVIPLSYLEDTGNIVLAPNDENAIVAIQEQLTTKIQEYVKLTTRHYIPRNEELCIAKFSDGLFYRGVTLESSFDPTHSQIFFFDYGNLEIVEHKDIRQITPDFIKISALGTPCNLLSSMFPQGLSEAAKKRVVDLVPIFEAVTVKIVSEDNGGMPCVEMPSIRVKLTEEKLI